MSMRQGPSECHTAQIEPRHTVIYGRVMSCAGSSRGPILRRQDRMVPQTREQIERRRSQDGPSVSCRSAPHRCRRTGVCL